jgi:hypothetical protein
MAALSVLFPQARHGLDEQLQRCRLEVGSSSFLKSERDRRTDYSHNQVEKLMKLMRTQCTNSSLHKENDDNFQKEEQKNY